MKLGLLLLLVERACLANLAQVYLWKWTAPYPFTSSTLQTLLAYGVNLLDVVHLVTLHPASCPAGKGEDTEMNMGGGASEINMKLIWWWWWLRYVEDGGCGDNQVLCSRRQADWSVVFVWFKSKATNRLNFEILQLHWPWRLLGSNVCRMQFGSIFTSKVLHFSWENRV